MCQPKFATRAESNGELAESWRAPAVELGGAAHIWRGRVCVRLRSTNPTFLQVATYTRVNIYIYLIGNRKKGQAASTLRVIEIASPLGTSSPISSKRAPKTHAHQTKLSQESARSSATASKTAAAIIIIAIIIILAQAALFLALPNHLFLAQLLSGKYFKFGQLKQWTKRLVPECLLQLCLFFYSVS